MKTVTGVVTLKRALFTCVREMFILLPNNGQDSLLGIASGYRLNSLWLDFMHGKDISLFFRASRPTL
jgi:hypothetical protein